MADQQPDMLAQIRALNPSLADYDDTTLAASIADQHPDYKPYLAKYLHPASAAAGMEGLPDSGSAAADLEKTLPTKRTTLVEALQGPPHPTNRMDLATALQTPPSWLTKPAEQIENPYVRGAAKLGASQITGENAMLMGGVGALPAKLGSLAVESLAAKSAADTFRSIPELWRLYKSGDMDKFKERATAAGLGGLLTTFLAHAGTEMGIAPKGAVEPAAEPPASTPAPEEIASQKAAQKATEAAGKVVSDIGPETKAAAEAQADVMRPQEPEPAPPDESGRPPFLAPEKAVTGQQGQKVIPNAPANPRLTEEMKIPMRQAGVDVNDPQQVANFLGTVYGSTKPIEVKSVGDVDVSESSETPTNYQLDLADGGADKVAHEVQHVRKQEGQIPEVPEGPGANDQIVSQVTQDIQGQGTGRLKVVEPGTGSTVGELLEEYFDAMGLPDRDWKHDLPKKYLAKVGDLMKMDPETKTNVLLPDLSKEPLGHGSITFDEASAIPRLLKQQASVPPGGGPLGTEPPIYQGPLPKIAEPSNVNLSRLDISNNAKFNILEMANEVGRGAPIPRSQTIASASTLGANLDLAKAIADGTKDLHIQVEAVKQYEGRAAEDYEAAKQTGDKATIKAARTNALEAIKAATQTLENAGRGLGAAGIVTKPSSAASATIEIGRLINQLEGRGANVEAMKEILDNTDLTNPINRRNLKQRLAVEGVKNASKEQTLLQNLRSFYMSNILSGIPTAGIKTTADLTTALASVPMEALGAFAKDPSSPRAAVAQAQARAAGMAAARTDALMAFTEAWKQGGSSHYERGRPFQGAGALNAVGRAITPPSFSILGGINDAFHMFNERGELYSAGIRDAIANDLPRDQWAQHAKEFADNPTQEALDAAVAEARKNTLTSPVGPLMQAVLTLRGRIPGGYLASPIVTVPTNLVKMGFEMSPFGAGKVIWDASQGKPISNQAAGRAVLGTMVFSMAMEEAMNHRMHGSGPTDKSARDALMKGGWRPDSWDIPGVGQVPMKIFGPLGFSMMTAANLAEVIQEAPRAPGALQAADAAYKHMTRTILDYPMLRGLNDAMEVLKNPNALRVLAGNAASGFIPYASLVARGASSLDDSQRKVTGFVDAIKARVPFLREQVPAKYDYVGNPLPAPGSRLGRFAAPVSTSDVTDSPTQKIAAGLGIAPNPTTIRFGPDTLKLNPQDAAELEQMAGKNVKATFDRLDKAPSQLLAPGTPEMLKKIIAGGRAAAQAQMLAKMKQDGRLTDYVGNSRVAAANKLETSPYALDLSNKAASQAKDLMDRFGVPDAGLPASVPPELAKHYLDQLQIARSTVFYPILSNASELTDFQKGHSVVQRFEDLAEKLALRQTLLKQQKVNRLQQGVQSQPAAP